jgi:hypothetical protein
VMHILVLSILSTWPIHFKFLLFIIPLAFVVLVLRCYSRIYMYYVHMYGECFALVTLTYHWQKFVCVNHTQFTYNSSVIVSRLSVEFSLRTTK